MPDETLSLDLEKCFENFDASISDVQKAYQKVWRQIDGLKNHDNLPKDYLAEMAGNLAHEIRNPLCGIANLVSLLSEGDQSQKSQSVHGILEGVQRIDKIVENLIVFSQPIEVHTISCNIGDILKSAVAIVKREYGAAVDIFQFELNLPRHSAFIKVDPELMLKVVKNVLQNALENMPDGGAIRLRLRRQQDVLHLTIRDAGIGLLNRDVEKPFYPFYTTKTYGMGLGLPIARLILEKHGCQIGLQNNQTEGTTVSIRYPIAAGA